MLLSPQLLSIECVNVDTNELFTIKRTSVIPDVPSPPTIKTANDMLYHLIHNYSKVKWMMRWPLTTAIWWVCSISFTDAFTNKALLNEVTWSIIFSDPDFVSFLSCINKLKNMPQQEIILLFKFVWAIYGEDTNKLVEDVSPHYTKYIPQIKATELSGIDQYIIDLMINIVGYGCGV